MSGVRVTPDNFARAESDLYFGNIVKDGGFGRFFHIRELTPIDHQLVIRANRDTLYSAAVFDLDAGAVTITLPDAGGRFLSMQVIDEDHYTPEVLYDAGEHTLTREQIGTRYVATAVRILVDPDDPDDLSAVHALQDAIAVSQDDSGSFDVPHWDPVSQRTVRDALITLATTLTDTRAAFGTRADTDPVRHLIGAANAWGGNPEKDALYLTVVPAENDGATVHRLVVGEVPVDGFWSVTVYNADGYFSPNAQNAYSYNNVTAQRDEDGTITIQFGGCDGATPNCLPITPGWNYTVRLYRPRSEVLDGTWTFPQAQPV
ncbi:DUF1254 domain-containing protein [Mycobacterium barrassiae]|uniref:DUF1254 domain-containing protein n=1 Tax=Mycobacterium barrassiae TaxID=319709 RepID=UPI002265838C|nr:DUF1254 domain-containing protein [Mycobacterium barrassiae]MCV7298936.1 DUF1254 domain-containing protein [Mycobacterium barrassiae]